MSVLKTTLRDLRKSKGLQQADLAALVGVRRETIGNLENGKYNPSLKLAMDIAKVFNKSFSLKMTKNNTSRSATKKMTAS